MPPGAQAPPQAVIPGSFRQEPTSTTSFPKKEITNNMDFGDFGRRRVRSLHDFGAGMEHISGPLIGGGAAQVGMLATKLLFRAKPNIAKWGGLIGAAVGGGISGALIASPRHRAAGWAGLVTALLIGIPRQVEDMLGPSAGMAGYFGVTVPEEIHGYGFGESPIQIMDAGAGSTGVLGVTVPEEQMSGPGDIEMLGGSGFGSNFLAAQ